jgi:hypothetical protein
MKIDISNYEVWFIDWLDGNLSDKQVEELMLFLEMNPYLKEEFDELPSLRLNIPQDAFQKKDLLKKSASEFPLSQLEYLSVAFLENDISPDQRSELKEIIEEDPEKLKVFELIQKTKLTVPAILYSHKHQLTRQPLKQKVIRWSLIGLSAAATIAIVIMSYLAIPHPLTDNDGFGKLSYIDSTNNNSRDVKFYLSTPKTDSVTDQKISITRPTPVIRRDRKHLVSTIKTIRRDSISDGLALISKFDSMEKILPLPQSMHIAIDLPNSIISQTTPQIFIPFEDDRSNVGRFIARVFREKVLKEATTKTSPLEVFEIAEAGVTGLNKLLGWQMALNKNIDEEGKTGSVYFSSRLLKFNTTVKKTENVP